MTRLKLKTYEQWQDLIEFYHEINELETHEFHKLKEKFQQQTNLLHHKIQKNKRKVLETTESTTIPSEIELSGITTRGPSIKYPCGNNAILDIGIGGRHAILVHSTG